MEVKLVAKGKTFKRGFNGLDFMDDNKRYRMFYKIKSIGNIIRIFKICFSIVFSRKTFTFEPEEP